jgi:hypothetical protein
VHASTTNTADSEQMLDVTYNYAAPWVVEEGRKSPSFAERSRDGTALAGFVSRKCGNVRDKTDGRGRRTKLVLDLQALDDNNGRDSDGAKLTGKMVDAYNACGRTIPWPAGKHKDKHYVMTQHLFCIAMENHADKDYVSEKVWDCIRAGAVPIYWGAPNVGQYLPGGKASAIFADDFKDVAALAAHLRKVGGNETLWQSYRQWVVQPAQSLPWHALMEKVNMKHAKCNLCAAVASAMQPLTPTPLLRTTTEPHLKRHKRAAHATPPNNAVVEDGSSTALLDARTWSVNQVADWAASKQFDKQMFEMNYIDGKLLAELDEEMLLSDLAMTSKLHRVRLLLEVRELFKYPSPK